MKLLDPRGLSTTTRHPTTAPGVREATYSQDEQRQRRRQWLPVRYSSKFDLAAEVSAIVGPLAEHVAALRQPGVLRTEVDDVADAVHELLSTVVGMLAESRRLDRAASARTRQAVRDLAQRPREPLIGDDMLISGSWAALLVSHVAPHAGDLAAYLGRATSPAESRTPGQSATERLESALRVLDSAALALGRRIPKAVARQSLPSIDDVNAAIKARHDAEQAERMLTRLKMGATR